jgi:hypothetical protein
MLGQPVIHGKEARDWLDRFNRSVANRRRQGAPLWTIARQDEFPPMPDEPGIGARWISAESGCAELGKEEGTASWSP